MSISISRHGLLYVELPLQHPSADDRGHIAFLQHERTSASHQHTTKAAYHSQALAFADIPTTNESLRSTSRPQNSFTAPRQLHPIQHPRARNAQRRLTLTHNTPMDMCNDPPQSTIRFVVSFADACFYDQHICHVPVEYTIECWNCSHYTCGVCLPAEQTRISLTRRSGSVDSQASDSDCRYASESDGSRSNRSDWEVDVRREELEGLLSRLDTVRRKER
jgi:hypothetical protein